MPPKTCDVPRYREYGEDDLRGMSFGEIMLFGGIIGFVIAMVLCGGIVLLI